MSITMEKKKIFLLILILIIVIGILMVSTTKRKAYREDQVEKFEKYYLPKKMKECLRKHDYSIENSSAKVKQKCEDYVKQIWEEQKVLNNVEE